MSEKSLVPKIRFKGFTNAWEQEKLGNLTLLNRFPQISAEKLSELNQYKGDVSLLPSSNNNNWRCSYNEKISHLINYAEVITLGRARNPNPKYAKGLFISSQNHIIESKKNDILLNKFLYFFINKVGRKFYSFENTYPMFTKIDFLNTKFLFPSVKEQEKILKVLNNLDSLITLHQRKYLALKNFKNTLLEKMFCDEKSKFPRIRFKGFTNAWEQEKLGDLIDKGGSGGTPNTSNKGYYNGEIPFLSISDLTKTDGYIYSTEKSITKKGLNSSSAWIVPKGSITLSMYATIGKVGILGNDLATSQAFYNMVINDKTTKNYVFHFLRKCDFTNKWFKLISIGTQANLNSEKIKNFIIDLPIDQKEQSKISSLFFNLDSLITLHQRKYLALKNFKNTLLEKMFCDEKSKFPRIRFKGFTNTWEQCKVGEIFNIDRGSGITRKDMREIKFGNFKYPVYSSQTSDEGLIGYYTKYMTDNAITWTTDGVKAGTVFYRNHRFFATSHCGLLTKKQFEASQYFSIIISRNTSKYVTWVAMPMLTTSQMEKITIICSFDQKEQYKISSLFSNLDSLITLHQRKLELLKNIKNTLLKKMFI
ncbi:restriction endonuclease subunit S [Mycoplasma feriruminatoris]|uniref:restriction endonuclease subunit S n=3 Tax=Mycoplasma feriruminatoris TaxID=1179777 RepID=UPI001EFB2EC3|nr:restriction endonuclease subunit S [Mycoplasma feriruminatoris]UKS54465.1 type I restriction modification DNA specificitydomain protein [Mycoplasma feriruminatoris]